MLARLAAIAKRLPERFGFQFVHGRRDRLGDVKSWLRDAMPEGRVGAPVSEPYAEHSTTALAIEILSCDSAAVGWELRRKGEEEPIEEHPVLDLFRSPNPFMLGEQLFTGTYVVDHLFGEAWWYFPDLIVGKEAGALERLESGGELWLIDPRRMEYRIKGGEIQWRLNQGNGELMTLDPEKLVQFKRFNPYDPFRGLSKMASIIAEVESDVAASRYNRAFFNDQNGVPTGLIIPSTPKQGGMSLPLDDAGRREFLRTFNDKHAKRRGIGMLPPGYSWIDMGISQRDMDYRGLREYSREEVLALWGVPPFLAGVLDKANYANAREQKEVYWQGTVTRFLKRYASVLTYDFLPKVGLGEYSLTPKWDTVKALLENLAEKTEVASKWFALGIPKKVINERLEMGWNEEDIADYSDGYLPLNLIPTGSIGDAFRNPPPPPDTEPGEEEIEEEEEERALVRTKDARETRRAATWKNLIVRSRDLEVAFDRVMRSHFKSIEQEALATIDSFKGWTARLTKNEEGLEVFDLAGADRKLVRRTKPHHAAALKRGGQTVLADIGIAINFDVNDPLVIAALTELSAKIKAVNRTVEAALRRSLTEGIAARETIDQLRDRVQQVTRVSLGRSRTIARTETGRAFNSGRNLSMKQAGITKHEWLSARDPDVRDSHFAVDGEVANIGEPFGNGLLFPQDPAGPPGEIINCRCVAVPVTTR